MITLTNPPGYGAALGSADTVLYDKFVITAVHIDVLGQAISGACRLSSSANPALPTLTGYFTISTQSPATGTLTVPAVSANPIITLSAGQITSILNYVTGQQNQAENALISFALVAGTQTPGT